MCMHYGTDNTITYIKASSDNYHQINSTNNPDTNPSTSTICTRSGFNNSLATLWSWTADNVMWMLTRNYQKWSQLQLLRKIHFSNPIFDVHT